MVEIIFTAVFFYIIFIISASTSTSKTNNMARPNFNIEFYLKQQGFTDTKNASIPNIPYGTYYTANKNGNLYLFKVISSANITDNEFRDLNITAKSLMADKTACISRTVNIFTEDTLHTANLYNVELWNYLGRVTSTQNQVIVPTNKKVSKGSRLARELRKEYEPLEHYKNGAIAKDTCHIAPTTSPIEERPTTFFKKKTQRL